jgi:hypothetical protein
VVNRSEELDKLLYELRRLRGLGPVQPQFYQWVADAREFLARTFGDPSPELAALSQLAFQNTPPDDAYMHHDGPWGLFERIARAEELLQSLRGRLDQPAAPAQG